MGVKFPSFANTRIIIIAICRRLDQPPLDLQMSTFALAYHVSTKDNFNYTKIPLTKEAKRQQVHALQSENAGHGSYSRKVGGDTIIAKGCLTHPPRRTCQGFGRFAWSKL